VHIICPVYEPGTYENETERYIIYNVSKVEYETCRITNADPRIIAICDKPQKLMFFTITFRPFTPQPGGLEFLPGNDYYFICKLSFWITLITFSEGFWPFSSIFWRILIIFNHFLKDSDHFQAFSEGFWSFSSIFWKILTIFKHFLKDSDHFQSFSEGFWSFSIIFWKILTIFKHFLKDSDHFQSFSEGIWVSKAILCLKKTKIWETIYKILTNTNLRHPQFQQHRPKTTYTGG
jgi:hypothetical protein